MIEYIVSSGVVSSGVELSGSYYPIGDRMIILDGGTATATTVNSSGYMYVSSGGTATATTVNSGGWMRVSSGGTATDTTVNDGGYLHISSGGTATDTTVNRGTFVVYSGGSVTGTTINNGHLTISSGGSATDTTVNAGTLYISSGGTATNTTVNSGCSVFCGGMALAIKENGGYVTGTNVTFVANTFSGLVLYCGATVHSGTTATDTTVNSGGYMNVFSGGIATDTTVNSSGRMYVYSGGTATDTTVNSRGYMYVSSGGSATDTTVNRDGYLNISSGGTATDTTVNWFGNMFVSSGGMAIDTTVNSLGDLSVVSGGFASNIDVAFGGCLFVNSGGKALAVRENGGYVACYSDKDISFVTNCFSGLTFSSHSATVHSGTTAFCTTLTSGCYLYVFHGGLADQTTVSSSFWVVNSGGSASRTVIDFGSMYVDGSANDTRVNSGGCLFVSGGGTANDNTICGGSLYVSSGGTADNTMIASGGSMAVYSCGMGSNIEVSSGGKMLVFSEGKASRVVVISGGSMTINYRGMGDNIIVNAGGKMTVSNGGTASIIFNPWQGEIVSSNGADVTYQERDANVYYGGANMGIISKGNTLSALRISQKQSAIVYADGTLTDTIINSGGHMSLENGANHRGTMQIAYGAKVFAETGALINFTVSEQKSPSTALISNWNRISGGADADYSITVKPNQANGNYLLATGAANFRNTVTVMTTDDTELGTLSVGETQFFDSTSYSLGLNNGTLTLSISGATTPIPPKSDLDGNGISDVMFQYTGGDYQIGFWMNGTSDWQGTTASQPANWKLLGNYDMDSNGLADQVMFGNVLGGAYIGYYKDGDTTSNGWVNIGYLSNPDGIVWQNAVGNLTGNAGCNSIVWQAPELGALGVWTDGTTNWVNLGGGYDSSWEMQGCGDFNGDGKDEVLFANNGNLYTIDIDGNFASLAGGVTGWEVRAIGDFSGDGQDDVVLFHSETGSVIKFENGTGYQNLGQLDKDDWFVVGAGDYNDDQQDDLLVRQYSTGMLGYYSAGDMKQWNELGRGVDMNWTVIA